MRAAASLSLVLLVACSQGHLASSATTADSTATKFAEYSRHAGVLLTKEFRGVGELVPSYGDTVTVTAVRISATGLSSAAYALRIQTSSVLGQETGVVDMDEVQAMDSAIGVMLHVPIPMDTNYVELDFVARGGLQLGVYREPRGYSGFLRPNANPRSIAPLTIAQLGDFQQILRQGIAMLRHMGAA